MVQHRRRYDSRADHTGEGDGGDGHRGRLRHTDKHRRDLQPAAADGERDEDRGTGGRPVRQRLIRECVQQAPAAADGVQCRR